LELFLASHPLRSRGILAHGQKTSATKESHGQKKASDAAGQKGKGGPNSEAEKTEQKTRE
jgi:hypothetical protein